MTRPPHCPDAALFHELLESTHCPLDWDIGINPGRAKNVHLFDTAQDAVTFLDNGTDTVLVTERRKGFAITTCPDEKGDLVRVVGVF